MRKQHPMSTDNIDTAASGVRYLIIRHRRFLFVSALTVMLACASLMGYLAGQSRISALEPRQTLPGTSGFMDQLAEQENRCALIEQINLKDELVEVQQEANALSESLARQQEAIDKQQEEMESLEENILNALMANLSEKMVSRSSPTVSSYIQEAKNLISLSRKIKTFEKTPESAEIDLTEYKAAITRQLSRIPTLKPIPGGLDGYGYRTHPVYGYRHFHPAVDMGAATGTPIKASAAGTVIDAGYNRYSGRYIKISHGNGFVTAYLHCSKLYVSAGERVDKGEVIAAVGNTGTSTTPHLHFEISFYGSPVNPRSIIME